LVTELLPAVISCADTRAPARQTSSSSDPVLQIAALIDDAAEKSFQRKCEPRKPAPPVTTETGWEFPASADLF
jgi:hypothetical protein